VFAVDGIEAHQNLMIVEWFLRNYPSSRNGGAVFEIEWLPKLRRAAMFVDEPRTRTSEVIEPSFDPDVDRSQEITAAEAAEILGVTPTHTRRIRHKIGFLREHPITFDRATVDAYKLRP
jgi:hypothetical protein